MNHAKQREAEVAVDVLIVGGGPVGAALAVELGSRGVRCLLVERRTERTPQPRAKTSNVRTMTLMRRWGLADAVRAAAPLPASFPSDIAFVTRLTGWELHRFRNALSTVVDRSRPYPETSQQCPQDVVEEVMRERAKRLPTVDWRQGVALEQFEQTAGSVRALVRDVETGRSTSVRARFLAGCDGARSLVREQCSIAMEGEDLGNNLSGVVRAPQLWSRNDKLPAVQYWLVNAEVPGQMGPLNTTELWWFHLNDVPVGKRFSEQETRQLFFKAVGAQLPCEVLASAPWLAQRLVAERYRAGPVFLLGDAAHVHPPQGGYGMNMGIGDAVDLGWKIGAVLAGWADDELLDSYAHERRPIHLRVIEEATINFMRNAARLPNPDLELEGPRGDDARARAAELIQTEKAREFASLGVQLGYRYEGSPAIVDDGTEPTPNEVSSYVPTARPGHLLPHVWIDDERCLYDLLGRDMTLLRLGPRPLDASPLLARAAAGAMPVLVVDVDSPELADLCQAPLVLVRPDQHVAWRGDDPVAACEIVDRLSGVARAQTVTGGAAQR